MKTCPLCETSYPGHHTTCPTDGAFLIDSHDLEPGTVIRGKYRIMGPLGRGGMGTVYLAEHILLDRRRALKFISAELAHNPTFLRRFRREAQAASELRHPNIVEVVDLDQAEDGTPYIAMEYVEGPDLRHALADGPFPVERALAITRGIAQGLGAAHAKGIIHRDVKPENILLATASSGVEIPKLLDFGIAAMKESATVATSTRVPLLTPDYAAPEQWRGMGAEELDGRADLYALGGVLNEMLTGQTSFHAHNTEGWMYQHLNEAPGPPSRLRRELANWPGLDELVLRLLAKDREDRPRDAGELVALLDGLCHVAPGARRVTVREERPHPETAEMPAVEPHPAPRPPEHFYGAPAEEEGKEVGVGPNWVLWLFLILVLVLAGFAVTWWKSPPLGPSTGSGGTTASGDQPQLIDAETEQKAEALFVQNRYSKALPLYEKTCADGNGRGCEYLGLFYLDGFGVAKSGVTAAAYYDRACNLSDSIGCLNLGGLYRDGTGVGKDTAKARELLDKACTMGESIACAESNNLH